MATDNSPENLRGFLIPWPFSASNIWSSQSNYSQENPYPDVPEPQSDTDLGLTTTGTFEAQEPLEIQTTRAGGIGNAGFVWKLESDTNYYGADGFGAISHWDIVQAGSSSSHITHSLLQAIALPGGEQLVLVEYRNTTANQKKIYVYKRDLQGTVTSSELYGQDDTTIGLKGSITILGDGSILAVFTKVNSSNFINMESYRSYDGDNWYLQSKRLLQEDIDGSGSFGAGADGSRIERVRIAESLGQIILLVNVLAFNTSLTDQNLVYQYSSTDNGCNFIHVANTSGTNPYFSIDLVVRNGQFQVFYIDNTDESQYIFLENSATPLDRALGFGATQTVVNGQFTISTVNGTYGYLEDGYSSIWIDSVGHYYGVYKDVGSGTDKRWFLIFSEDGENWVYYGHNDPASSFNPELANLYTIDDNSIQPTEISGCSGQGMEFLFHNYEFVGSHNYGGIHVFQLGGWSSINLPANTEFPQLQERANWNINWVPYSSPDQSAHFSKVGSGTITATTTAAEFNSTSSQSVYVETPLFSTRVEEGVIIRTRLEADQAGELDKGRGVQVQTTDRMVSIYVDTNAIALYDEYGTSQIAQATVDTTNGLELLLVVVNNKARAWYRVSGYGAKSWIALGNGSLTSGATATNTRIRYGHLSAPLGILDLRSRWYELHYSYGLSTGLQLEEEPANPEDLQARLYPPQGKTEYVEGGTQISTYDGPGYYGDEYKIQETATSPIRNMFIDSSRSPRVTWRSADTGAQTIALYLDTTLQENDDSTLGNGAIGIHLSNINFRRFEIQYYRRATTSWTSLGTFDNDIGGSFSFTRIGSTIYSTASSGQFLELDECRNWTILLDNGSTVQARKIRTNTEGTLDAGTARKRAALILDDATTSDHSSGTAYLIPRSCTVIANLPSYFAAIKIIISAQETPEDVFTIGSFIAGPVIIPQQYSRGRSVTFEPGTLAQITNDGQELVREQSPGARVFRIGWTDGVDTSDLYDSTPDPDYYTLQAGGVAIGAPSSTPSTMLGLARYCNGQNQPLVFLPKIARASTQIINRRERQVLGSIQGEISIEHVLGDEFTGDGAGELYRVSSMVIRELI